MRLVLFSDRGCPFTHRARALLHHLDVAHEHQEARVGERPPGLLAHSSTGQLPLLLDGDLVLTESRVILEHLAERFGWSDAWPAALSSRSEHRRAMAIVDAVIVPTLFGGGAGTTTARREEHLDAFEAIAARTPPQPSLLAFHAAPMWLRLRWLRPNSDEHLAVLSRPRLAAWLETVAALNAVMATSPDWVAHRSDYRRMMSSPR